jgi:hypothetical protein
MFIQHLFDQSKITVVQLICSCFTSLVSTVCLFFLIWFIVCYFEAHSFDESHKQSIYLFICFMTLVSMMFGEAGNSTLVW